MPRRAAKAPEPQASNSHSQRNSKAFLSRHSTKCRVCNHPDRAAIEFDFLNWRNPGDLVRSYRFRGLSTIYRHAHATGLLAKRRLNLRFAMERIVERVGEVPVTATAVIRAARAITRINDAGEWNDPPTRLIIERTDSSENRLAAAEQIQGVGDPEATRRAPRSPARGAWEIRRPRPVPIFDAALLDEPSDSANAAGELPKIPGEAGRAVPPEYILTLTPEFQAARNERNRAIEEDRLAKAAKDAAFLEQARKESTARAGDAGLSGSNNELVVPPSSSLPQAAVNAPAPATQTPPRLEGQAQNGSSGASSPLPQRSSPSPEKQTLGAPSTLLPQAVFLNSATPALTDPSSRGMPATRHDQTVAAPSSTLPAAVPDKPATAKQSPRVAGPQLGSSASVDPPFPFIPRVPLRRKARRHFLIENEMRSRGESND